MSVERFADPQNRGKVCDSTGSTDPTDPTSSAARTDERTDGAREAGSTVGESLLKAWSHRRVVAAIFAVSMFAVVAIGLQRPVTYTAYATLTLEPDPDQELTRWVRNQGLLIYTDKVEDLAEQRFNGLGVVKTEAGGFFGDVISVRGIGADPDTATRTANAFAESYEQLGRTVIATGIVANRRSLADQKITIRRRLAELETAIAATDDYPTRIAYQTELESWLALQTKTNAVGRVIEERSRRMSDVKRLDLAFGAVESPGTPLTQLVFMGFLVGLLLSSAALASLTGKGVALTKLRELEELDAFGSAWAIPSDPAWSIRRSFRRRRPLRSALARSQSLESLRAIRTALATYPELGGRVILVTSPNRNEGKSVTALLLAQAIARTGKRVLLVDAHLRAPKAHLLCGTKNTGIAELKPDDPNPRRSAQRITSDTRFDVLCAGRSHRPSEHMTEVITASWIVRLLGKYDLVVIDGPPVLDAAETKILANLSDVVAVVSRSRRTTHDSLRSSIALLDSIGCSRRIMILNRTTPKVRSVVADRLRLRRPQGNSTSRRTLQTRGTP
jgi:Mrp family chromosome partitioning ATPase